MKRFNLKMNKSIFIYIVLFVPFFELQTFEMLESSPILPELWSKIMISYSILRLLITTWLILNIMNKEKICISAATKGIVIFLALENLASLLNGSLYINYFIGSFSIVGLLLLCEKIIKKSPDKFLRASLIFFGCYSILGAIQIILQPNGFYNPTYGKAYGIYLLGSKNSSIFYFIVFLYLMIFKACKEKKSKNSVFIYLILFVIASLCSDSMNSVLALLIIAVFMALMKRRKIIQKFFSERKLISLSVIIACILLVPEFRKCLAPILKISGRDLSFTGRDVLWSQGINAFLNHPFIGNGINTQFFLKTGVAQNHCHNYFLDQMAKYGLFSFIAVACTIIAIAIKTSKMEVSNEEIRSLNRGFIFVMIIHSMIDQMNIYILAYMLITIELLTVSESKNELGYRQWRKRKIIV